MAAPTISYNMTIIDIMNGGGNLYSSPTIESASDAGSYRDDQNGTGWDTSSNITGLYGAEVALTTASSDFTQGQYIWFQVAYEQFNSPNNYDTLVNGGARVAFIDGSGNWARYNINGSDVFAGSSAIGGYLAFRSMGGIAAAESGMLFVIDMTRTPDAESGTAIDWTDVDIMGSYVNASSSDRTDTFTGRINVADRPLQTGGDITTPAGNAYFYAQRSSIPNSGGSNRWFTEPPEGFGGANGLPYVTLYGAEFGDGVTPTYWREIGGQTAYYPSRDAQEVDATGIKGYGAAFNGDGTNGHGRSNRYVQTSTCDHVSVGHTWTGTDHPGGEYDLVFTGHASATNHSSTNDLVLRANSVVYTEWDISGNIYDDCESVSIDANTTLVAAIFRNLASTSEGLVYTGVAADKSAITVEFKATNAGVDLTLGSGGAGTYTFSGLTVESGHTLAIHNNSATNAITVVVAAGITTSKTTAGGSISIVQAAETYTFNSDTSATLIRYFEDDLQTIVDSATDTTLAYEFPDADPVDAEFLKQGYVPVNRQDVVPTDGGTLDIIMDLDEAYNSAHGLTITSEYDYVRATKVLTINSDQEALDVRSALADVIRTNSGYYNTALQLVAIPGLTRVDLTNGATITSMATWKGAGMEMFDAADALNAVEKWFSVKSVGTITGATTHYRQTDSGSSTAITLTGNVVNEAFQYWDDPDHDGSAADGFDYSDYMVIKSFLAGSKQGRVDVLANSGLSALNSNLFTVPLSNADHDYSGTDPGITADITLIAGGTVGGVAFAYEIVDGGTNTGANIADQLNYNAATNPNTVIAGGTLLTYFELSDMVIHNATAVETERGYLEGTTPAFVGFYVSRSSADHPDFTRFQGDNGTYYTPAVQNQATITNLTTDGANILLQIYNITTATQIYAADPSSATYSESYTEGANYSDGDEIRIRFAELNGAISFKSFETIVAAGATGWSLNAANFIISNAVYATNAVDPTISTKFSYSAVDDQFNLTVAQNFQAGELFAFYCLTLTTAPGIEGAFGAFIAENAGNYKNITAIANIFLDNETTSSQRQTDSARIYKDDGAYPVLDPTTSGFGIDVNWKNVVYVVSTGGSSLSAGEKIELTAAAQASTVNTKIGAPVVDVATDIAALNNFDPATDTVARVTLVDTVTLNSDMRGTDGANTVAPDNSGIVGIKAKTDSLTFTVANKVDSNVKSVNDSPDVTGTGTELDPWGP